MGGALGGLEQWNCGDPVMVDSYCRTDFQTQGTCNPTGEASCDGGDCDVSVWVRRL